MSEKNEKVYDGMIDGFPKHKIHLNVTHLEAGIYILKIMHKNKLIKKTTFKKQ
tara:strand:- start:1559 stop:1717 length:159 start_codon:yes stop_codon:yes gene_type:complete